jgi:hypothetical protein
MDAFEAALNYARFSVAHRPAMNADEMEELLMLMGFTALVEQSVTRKRKARHAV